MRCKIPAVLLLSCLLHIKAFSQTTADSAMQKKDKPVDTSYIKFYDNYLNFTTGWSTRNTKYTISYPNDHVRFMLSPKETNQFNFSLDYSFVYAFYSFTPKAFNNKDTIKGNSKRSTFGMGFSFKRWSFNFDYQKIKGYYLQNTNEFIPGWENGDAYLKFPDLKTIQIGGQVGYNFNKKFSIASLTSGKEKQLKSAITFNPMLAYWHIKMRNESKSDSNTTSNEYTLNNDINLLLPLSAIVVFAKDFYISAFAGPIVGVDFYKANGYDKQTKTISTSETNFSTGYYLRASIGYTGNKFFTGIDVFARNYGHQQEDKKFNKNSYGMLAYVGMRFNPPRFLKKHVDWLQNNRPF